MENEKNQTVRAEVLTRRHTLMCDTPKFLAMSRSESGCDQYTCSICCSAISSRVLRGARRRPSRRSDSFPGVRGRCQLLDRFPIITEGRVDKQGRRAHARLRNRRWRSTLGRGGPCTRCHNTLLRSYAVRPIWRPEVDRIIEAGWYLKRCNRAGWVRVKMCHGGDYSQKVKFRSSRPAKRQKEARLMPCQTRDGGEGVLTAG